MVVSVLETVWISEVSGRSMGRNVGLKLRNFLFLLFFAIFAFIFFC